MEFAIKVLTDELDRFPSSYIKYVDNGDISPSSNTAIDQKGKIKSCEDAIKKLNE